MANNQDNTGSKQLDDPSDKQLEQLLKTAYNAPTLRPDFRESLLGKLEQEFVQTRQHPTSASLSGASSEAATPAPQRKIGLPLAVALALAASLLLAVALWNNQTAYGWASMLAALEQCDWVQVSTESTKQTQSTGWASSGQGVLAIRVGEQISYQNHQQHAAQRYFVDQQVVLEKPLAENITGPSPVELFRLLLANDNTTADSQSTFARAEVVAESWRRTSADDASASVELRVTLRVPESPAQTVELLVALDPATKLPQNCRLLSETRGAGAQLHFTYPSEGPSSIYALGVPRETEIVVSLAAASPSKSQAQETESTQLALHNAPEQDESAEVTHSEMIADRAAEAEATDEIVGASSPPTDVTSVSSNTINNQDETALAAVDVPDEPLPLDQLVAQVNASLASHWQAQGISPSAPADDAEFVRRVYLDLTGRIPLVSEVYQFMEDPSPDRRERLVDELLTSHDHATHLASVWRTMLLPEGSSTRMYGDTGNFDVWLAERFEQNLPYDQLVRELLLAEGRVSDSGPILFYAALKLNPEELAAKTARAFLGLRMECAQCHDHPFDEAISQYDFWGFAAHFAQISRPVGKMEMTSAVLRVRDTDHGDVMLPDTDEVIPPRLPYKVSYVPEPETPQDIAPSRREVMVDWLTSKQNSRFARATVNRVWQHLFGLGLVEPVDDMRADNFASCPAVLDSLSLDFAASNYDLRRLLRVLVLSDVYQLSSQATQDDPSQALNFARMNVKSFTADQLYDCISVATMRSEAMNDLGLARFGNSTRQAFIEQFQAPAGQRTDYHAGIPQALTLMHGYLVHSATDLASSGLLKSLEAPFFS